MIDTPTGDFTAIPIDRLTARPTYPPAPLSLLDRVGHRTAAFTHLADQGAGSYGHGVVLAVAPESEYHAYVVWTAIDRPDGLMIEQGDYCLTLREAFDAYTMRGGKAGGWNHGEDGRL